MVTRTERGWPGHYICAEWCLFRRNTLLECDEQRIVVSTVGKSRIRGEKEWCSIGGNGEIFETMTFAAHKTTDGYWDANVRIDIPGGVRRTTSYEDRDGNDMHEAVVSEMTGRLESRELLYTETADDIPEQDVLGNGEATEMPVMVGISGVRRVTTEHIKQVALDCEIAARQTILHIDAGEISEAITAVRTIKDLGTAMEWWLL